MFLFSVFPIYMIDVCVDIHHMLCVCQPRVYSYIYIYIYIYICTYTRSHPFLHSLRQKSLNSSFPVILLLVRLILFHLISFKLFLLQLFLHSLTSLTSLHTGGFPSAFKQARITPLLKKPTLNPTLLGNYRPVSLLPFIAKTLERVVFNQVSAFLTQNKPPGQ